MKRSRESEILEYLEKNSYISTEQAMEMFGKSAASIRRDFTRLAENGNARRVQGGLRAIQPDGNHSIPFFLRERKFMEEKAAIAQKAAEFFPKNGVCFIHSGSTTLLLGNHINSGTVITNCLTFCELLRSRFPSGGGPELIVPCGSVDLKAGIIAGSKAEATLRDYYADTVFFSCRGMDKEGLLDVNDTIAASSRTMIERSRRVIMLADHSKFRTFGLSRLVPWSKIHMLITTETEENRPFLQHIRSFGVEICPVK